MMALVGNTYTADFGPFKEATVADNTSIVISIVAVDVEGNTSSTSVAVTVNSIADCFG